MKKVPKRVLVVDDDTSACRLLEAHLRGPDLEVVFAHSGDEAIQSATTARPDLIVMDLVMPGMDGLTAIRQIKSKRGLESVPIFVLTGNADPENIRAAVDLGAEDFLAKSVLATEEAPARIRRALGLPISSSSGRGR
jgi:CheY-like chemotaxis protein